MDSQRAVTAEGSYYLKKKKSHLCSSKHPVVSLFVATRPATLSGGPTGGAPPVFTLCVCVYTDKHRVVETLPVSETAAPNKRCENFLLYLWLAVFPAGSRASRSFMQNSPVFTQCVKTRVANFIIDK